MRLASIALLSILGAVLGMPLVAAGHDDDDCSSDGQLAFGVVTVGSGRGDDPNPTIYIDDRNFVTGNGIWIYYECNGIDGLQRGGASPWYPDTGDLCVDDPNLPPDCVLF